MNTDAQHWAELQRLFHLAARLPRAERPAALAAANPDPTLQRRALELVTAAEDPHTRAPPTLRPASARAPDPGVQAGASPAQGGRIGPYRLLKCVGSGGMGTVYLAERVSGGITLRSALKVLAAHATDPEFIERFRREEQNLAALEHPNITRLLDAGWIDGVQPYLVMEYVEGERLDVHCDQRRLGIQDRLRLFVQVCAAVSHAHRNLIVHLDLKPSNVLVTADGIVKLLDFGTSKLVQADGSFTATIVATPAYASPEQLLNEPLTTASDVYSLGAVLYQLLAGRTPFGNTSSAAMIERAAREAEPARIDTTITHDAAEARGLNERTLRHALRGDLATITARCLARQPAARYASVDALANDLQRHLEHLPILARPQTFAYRTARFVRRRRVAVVATALAMSALLASVGYAWYRQREALVAAERAVQMQSFLYRLFKMSNPTYTGKPSVSISDFLRLGLEKLPEFIHDPGDLAAAQLGMAESLYQTGDLDGARKALEQVVDAAHAAGALAIEAEALAYAADVHYQQGQVDTARSLARRAMALSRTRGIPPRVRILSEVYYATGEDGSGHRSDANLELLRAAADESQRRQLPDRDRAFALNGLAVDLEQRGRRSEALAIFEELRRVYERDPLAVCDRADIDAWLAWIHDATGDIAGSLPLFKRGYEGYVACAGAESQGAVGQLSYWADGLTKSGQPQAAIDLLEKELPSWRRRWTGVTDMTSVPLFLARAYNAVGRHAEAAALAQEAASAITAKPVENERILGVIQLAWAQALVAQRLFREAQPHAQFAARALAEEVHSDYGRQLLADAQAALAAVDRGLAAR